MPKKSSGTQSANFVERPKKDDDMVQYWRQQIDLGIKWRWRTSGKNDRFWTKYKQYYRGNWSEKFGVLEDSIQLDDYLPTNRIFSYIRSIVPKVYFRNPGVLITKGNSSPQGLDDTRIVQTVADYLIRELRLKRVMKRAVLCAMLTGVAIVKEGWGSIFLDGVERQDAAGNVLEHAAYAKVGLPWAQAIDPMSFVVPYGTRDFEECDWCAHAIWRPVEYARQDQNFAHRSALKGTNIPNDLFGILPKPPIEETSALRWVRLWEVHDKTSGALYVIADGSPFLHYKGTDELQIEHLPFRVLTFDEDLDTMWAISTVKIMEPQQLELNDIRTMEASYRRRDFTKILVDSGVPDSAVSAINDASTPLAAVKIPEPRKNVMILTSGMPADLSRSGEEADNDLRYEVGFSRNQAGEVSTGRRTAREIEVARMAAEIRNDERRDATSDFFAETVNDLLQISFKFMSSTTVERIAGQSWASRDPSLLPYDLGIIVNPEESRPMNAMVQRSEAVELFGALQGNPVVNPIALVLHLLEEYDIDPMTFIDPQVAQVVAALIQSRQQGGGQQNA